MDAIHNVNKDANFTANSRLANKLLWRLVKLILKPIPVIGTAYEIVDDVLLRSIQETRQEQVNAFVMMLQNKLSPILDKLANEDIVDEKLPERLNQPDVCSTVESFRQEFIARQREFTALTTLLQNQLAQHEEKIVALTESVANISQNLEIGAQFKYIAQSVKHHLSLYGSVWDMYDHVTKLNDLGGQGIIYRAHKKGMPANKTVALKVLKSRRSDDAKAIQRFLLEGFLSSQISHPNIVRVSDYGGFFSSDEYFIEMEDLGDVTWKHWAEQNPLTDEHSKQSTKHSKNSQNDRNSDVLTSAHLIDRIELYLDLILQALNALSAIHKDNLVHRDIKPSNFMVKDNRLFLIDFGSVKSLETEENLRLGQTMTSTGEMVGTPKYMSPEQFDKSKGKISSASDVYSLGVTLFEFFTGQLPFDANTFIAYAQAHLYDMPVFISEYNPEIPMWLAKLVSNMLKKQPSDRDTIEMIRYSISQNRKATIHETKEKVAQIIESNMQQTMSQDTHQKLLVILSTLKDRLVEASPVIKKDLVNFIANTQLQIEQIQNEKQSPIDKLTGFDPHKCPNLLCSQILEDGCTTCPQCHVSWKMPCVCDKKRQTPYQEHQCQKCPEGKEIPLQAKRIYSLLVTLQECERQQHLSEAMAYAEKFSELIQQSSELQAIYQRIPKMIQEQAKKRQEEIVASIEAEAENLLRKQATEQEKLEKKRQQELATYREKHISEIQKLIQSEKYKKALDYYQNNLPKSLHNSETQAIYEQICDLLYAEEISQANDLLSHNQYKQVADVIAKIPDTFRTTTTQNILSKVEQRRKKNMKKNSKQKEQLKENLLNNRVVAFLGLIYIIAGALTGLRFGDRIMDNIGIFIGLLLYGVIYLNFWIRIIDTISQWISNFDISEKTDRKSAKYSLLGLVISTIIGIIIGYKIATSEHMSIFGMIVVILCDSFSLHCIGLSFGGIIDAYINKDKVNLIISICIFIGSLTIVILLSLCDNKFTLPGAPFGGSIGWLIGGVIVGTEETDKK